MSFYLTKTMVIFLTCEKKINVSNNLKREKNKQCFTFDYSVVVLGTASSELY